MNESSIQARTGILGIGITGSPSDSHQGIQV
jgi:hypothetical protein